MTEVRPAFLPAMGTPAMLPFYDLFGRAAGIDTAYWQLVAQAAIEPGARVLEIGCGSGNVLLLAARAVPDAVFTGVDPDRAALDLAARKAAEQGATIAVEQGYAQHLTAADGSVDRVLSSLMLHHLPAADQVATLREVRRVLAPGGSLHLVDLVHDPRTGPPKSPLHVAMRGVNKALTLLGRGGHQQGQDHGHGHGHGHGHDAPPRPVVELLREAGFTEVREVSTRPTRLGPLTFYRAAG
jgi:ubiquinone/menaquinone biosynthesis C-methylase UbiE